jgi:hypothetical protein
MQEKTVKKRQKERCSILLIKLYIEY